ncbi:DUF4126 domain-containing protein [Cyanobacteria bacterium FACHB-DQ100]|uniref:DUF4126 family protein n=1 Tax=unclassified Leptolyngbya TaxID=2650499 RepID=UPI001681A331|nr:DUF4126 domain-containing protein [Cyanobacteria bacterium FACHB-DQ100]MBD2080546.1 DUF4126 domain-containing protein [Leptolyngbya sp. FACHB-17]
MDSTLHTIIEILLGISLSAAAGFRVFIPLLIVSGVSVFGHYDLPADFDWLENSQAFGLFAIASILEVIGYSIPWFDHALDVLATPAAMIAGTVVAASVAPDMNPLIQWTLAIVAGGGTAGITKLLTNLLRGTSTAASGGLTNPIFAAVELAIAVLLSVLALTAPIVAGLLVIGLFSFGFYRLTKFVTRWRTQGRVKTLQE